MAVKFVKPGQKKGLCFVLCLNPVLYFCSYQCLLFHGQKAETYPSAVCTVCWTSQECLHAFTQQEHQRLWHTRSPWANTEVLLESVLRGLCRVERAVGGKSSSPFTTFSTQHGRHTLVYGTSPIIEWVLNAVISYLGVGATLI